MIEGFQNEHKTLDSISEFISALGWMIFIGGLIFGLIGFISLESYGGLGWTGIGGGLGLMVTGIIIVGQGQVVKVIGLIELNTQRTYLLLKNQRTENSEVETKELASETPNETSRREIRSDQGMASDEFEVWLTRVRRECPEYDKASDAYLYNTFFRCGKNP